MDRTKQDTKKDRQFGLFLAAISLGFAGYFYLHAHSLNLWLAGLGVFLLPVSLVVPSVVRPLRKGMEKLGHWMGIVNTYVVLTLIYVLLFVPLNLFFRITGKDILNQKRDSGAKTYWVDKTGQNESSMRNQF